MPDRITTIKEETRLRILRVVEEMGYRASWRGQMLAKSRTQTIAVVNAAPFGAVPRGVYWEIVNHVEMQLGQFDLSPTFLHIKDHEERFDRMLGDARFDGCLSLGLFSPKVLDILRRNKVPTVLINAEADPAWTCVNVDDESGTRAVMRHLLSLGHKRIACNLGETPPAHFSVSIRAATYEQCMREAGLIPEEPFVGPVEQLVGRVLASSNGPTAILDYEHWSAVRLLQALWRKGVRVPDDISVATFNDTYPVTEVIPPLTTVALPTKQIAEEAVRLLLESIEQPLKPLKSVVLQESLVVRESTSAPKG